MMREWGSSRRSRQASYCSVRAWFSRLTALALGATPSSFSATLPTCLRAGTTDKHVRQGFSHLGFIASIALKHLRMKRSGPVSGDVEVLNAPGGSHQVAGVGPIAVPTTSGRAFAPRGSDALLELFAHDLFNQDLDGAHGQPTQVLTKLLLVRDDG